MTDRDPTINVRLRKSGRTKHFTIFEAGAYGWHTCDPDTGGQITQLRDWEAALTRRLSQRRARSENGSSVNSVARQAANAGYPPPDRRRSLSLCGREKF